jgi:hypothetical protein
MPTSSRLSGIGIALATSLSDTSSSLRFTASSAA